MSSWTPGAGSTRQNARRVGFSEPAGLESLVTRRPRTVSAWAISLLQRRAFTILNIIGLLFALIARDAWNCIGVPEHPGDDILVALLSAVVAIWTAELVAAIIATEKAFLHTPFFWVDLLAIVSICSEFAGIRANNLEGTPLVGSTLRKIISALRECLSILRIMKFVSYIDGGSCRLPQSSDVDRQILSQYFLKAFSTKVPLFMVALLAVLPLIKMDWFANRWTSMTTWMMALQHNYKRAVNKCQSRLDPSQDDFMQSLSLMEEFYSNAHYQPYEVVGIEHEVDVNGRLCKIPGKLDKDYIPARAEYVHVETARDCPTSDCGDWIAPDMKVYFNFETIVKMQSGERILFTAFLTTLLLYVMYEVRKTLKSIGDMEKYANLSRIFMKPKNVDFDEYENLEREEKGVLEMMGCEGGRRRSSVAIAKIINLQASSRGEHTKFEQEVVDSWDLDVCTVNQATQGMTLMQYQAHILSYVLFRSALACRSSRVHPKLETFANFTAELQPKYNDVKYHSYDHAVDVAHTVYRLMCELHAESWLGDVQRYSLLIAALGHDVGHFGRNNDFLCKTGNALAIQYNDQSPLENMHCATLFQICEKDDANVFKQLSVDDKRTSRKLCIAAILHTDMVHHPQMQKHLIMLYERTSALCHAQAQEKNALLPEFEEEVLNKEHDFWAQDVLVHIADVSNPGKPFPICQAWAIRCVEEFWDQGDEEKSLGLPVGMLNDREKVSLPGSQHGFINFLVAPVFIGAARIFQSFVPLADQMVDNLASWRDIWVSEANPSETEIAKRDSDILKLKEQVQAIAELGLERRH